MRFYGIVGYGSCNCGDEIVVRVWNFSIVFYSLFHTQIRFSLLILAET
jgi:hypothetical protein